MVNSNRNGIQKHRHMKYSRNDFNYPNEPSFIRLWPVSLQTRNEKRIQTLSKILQGISLFQRIPLEFSSKLAEWKSFHSTCQRINPFKSGYEILPFPWVRKQLRFQKRKNNTSSSFFRRDPRTIRRSVISSHSISYKSVLFHLSEMFIHSQRITESKVPSIMKFTTNLIHLDEIYSFTFPFLSID